MFELGLVVVVVAVGLLLWHHGKLTGVMATVKQAETKAAGFISKIKEEVKAAEEAAKK